MAGAFNLLMGSLWMRRTAALLTASAVVAVVGADASAVRGAQPPALPSSCSDNSPCRLAAGTYRMGFSTVIEGLRLTLPQGLVKHGEQRRGAETCPSRSPQRVAVHLARPRRGQEHRERGRDKLPGVGRTPAKLIGWLTHNPDFAVDSRPSPSSLVHGVRMTTLALGVSTSAEVW